MSYSIVFYVIYIWHWHISSKRATQWFISVERSGNFHWHWFRRSLFKMNPEFSLSYNWSKIAMVHIHCGNIDKEVPEFLAHSSWMLCDNQLPLWLEEHLYFRQQLDLICYMELNVEQLKIKIKNKKAEVHLAEMPC